MHTPVSTGSGVLNYGSVELCLYRGYHAGDAIRIHHNLFIEVVERFEQADGIIVLGLQEKDHQTRPTCHCILFTHYYRHPHIDRVDHAATVIRLSEPSEAIRLATEQAFYMDLLRRSLAASFAYTPSVRYL